MKKKIKKLTIEDIERACMIFNSKHRLYKIYFYENPKEHYIMSYKHFPIVSCYIKADTIDNLLDLFEDLIKDLR